MKKLFFIAILSSVLFYKANSQEVVATAGEVHETDDMSISWTIGEAVIETFAKDNLLLSQGFHQGNLEVSTAIENIDKNTKISVFPNPVNSTLNIEIETDEKENFEILLFDMAGKLLLKREVSKIDNIDLSHLQSATYRLQVKDKQNRNFKFFNILKIK